ncbi:hypothetical protein QQ020_21735 [Fulvivirgaceae bacterium BMA12]|uniref:Uncharacterized protein n=1 Tax=Agaribacillus aureus TaxID=3051825 RepID=A0ABT8LD87_9BACT|nr:hypothetical protein [Fulvivirgaceae bacterium BMA12]
MKKLENILYEAASLEQVLERGRLSHNRMACFVLSKFQGIPKQFFSAPALGKHYHKVDLLSLTTGSRSNEVWIEKLACIPVPESLVEVVSTANLRLISCDDPLTFEQLKDEIYHFDSSHGVGLFIKLQYCRRNRRGFPARRARKVRASLHHGRSGGPQGRKLVG